MDKINIGFYLMVIGVSFAFGCIVGGLIVHFVGNFFRNMDYEIDQETKDDLMDGG